MKLIEFKSLKENINLIFLSLVLVFTRVYMLGRDLANLDAFHFKGWSYVFMKELEAGNWDRLLVTIQPGAFTVYSNVIGFKAVYFLKDKFGIITAEGKQLELLIHTFQKIPQSLFIVALVLFAVYLIFDLINKKAALIFLVIYTFEPVFIAHSRVIQTDALQGMLMFVTVLTLVKYLYKKDSIKWLIVSGIFGGFSFIQKSPAITLLGIVPAILFVNYYLSNKDIKFSVIKTIKDSSIFAFILLLTSYIFFPAFWFYPLQTFKRMTIDAFLFGVEGVNTENYTYEKYVDSSIFSRTYLNYLVFRHSLVYLIGIVLFIFTFFKNKTWKIKKYNKLILSIFIFSLIYFLMLQVSSKKYARYLIVITMPLTVVSALGYLNTLKLFDFKKLFFKPVTILVFAIFSLGIFNYFNWMPNIMGFNNLIARTIKNEPITPEWGTGYYSLGQYLEQKYGPDQKVLTGDHMSLYLFYPGEVKSYDPGRLKEGDWIVINGKKEDLDKYGYKKIDEFYLKNKKLYNIHTKNSISD